MRDCRSECSDYMLLSSAVNHTEDPADSTDRDDNGNHFIVVEMDFG